MNVTNSSVLLNINSGRYPMSLADVRVETGASFAAEPSEDLLGDVGYAVVHPSEQPLFDEATQVVEQGAPTLTGGEWKQSWVVRDHTAEEAEIYFTHEKARVLQAIKALQAESIEKGCAYTFPDATVGHVQLRDGDRGNLAGLKLRAQDSKNAQDNQAFFFRTYENKTKMGLTADDIIAICDTAFTQYMFILGTCWAMRDLADAATDLASLPEVPETIDA